ncbi:hypothetical protein [Agromyces silvae]|uniref:hypothetical protein n=1 Tax=Agromyces silvae TaxID=3388266 RepID=UPI00280B620A|nr:hypothetical protein [Agromyces protaetiae]
MTHERDASWLDSRPSALPGDTELDAEQRLEYVDRIIGLEQQVRELQAAAILSPSETVAAERNLASIRGSATWRAGRAVMLPVRVLRYAKRRILR